MDNKTFVNKLAKKSGNDTAQVMRMVSALGTIIKERSADLDSIAIPGFGNFVAMKKNEHIVYDSATGRRLLMPPKVTIEFVAGSMLKKQVAHE